MKQTDAYSQSRYDEHHSANSVPFPLKQSLFMMARQ